MKIGGAYFNVSENGNTYLNLSFNDEFKQLMPEFKELKINLFEIPEQSKKEDGPSYDIWLFKPKPKQNH